MPYKVQATTQGHTLCVFFLGVNVCGLERILFITPNPVPTLPHQMSECRACGCYAVVTPQLLGLFSNVQTNPLDILLR